MLRLGEGEGLGNTVSQSPTGAVNSKRVLVWKPERKQNKTKQKPSDPVQA